MEGTKRSDVAADVQNLWLTLVHQGSINFGEIGNLFLNFKTLEEFFHLLKLNEAILFFFFGFPHKNCSLSSATPAVSSSSIHSPQKQHHISCTRWNVSDVEDHAWQPHDLPYEQMKLWTIQVLCFCSGLSPKLRPYVSPLSYVWGVQPWPRLALPREAVAPTNKNCRESPILGYMNESDYIRENVYIYI